MILVHDGVAMRNGSLRRHNKHNDTRQELCRMLHKLVGQDVVLAEGRVEADDKLLARRQHACNISNA